MPSARVLAGVRDGPGCVSALALLLVLLALAPLANSSPPDPLWIAGIYDDADFDEAIVAVLSVAGVVETVVLLRRLTDIPAGEVRPHRTLLRAAAPASTFSIRAPPSARIIAAT
jgi:hypothetical protein